MTDHKMSDIIPLLRQFGIPPEMLGPDKLEKLMKIAAKIRDPSKVTPEISREMMRTLGVNTAQPAKHKSIEGKKKIGRNDPCPCKSGKKWKKCCFNRK
jgi:uncharacterized protein YecA (UPF0149 family)